MIALLPLLPLLPLLLGIAQAGDLSLGVASVINDPFLGQQGVVLGGSVPVTPGARLGLSTGYHPNLGRADWKSLTETLVDDYSVSPDISRRGFDGAALLTVEPFRGPVAGLATAVAIYGGVGLVWTRDDLDALQTDSSDERAVSTERQLHPDLAWGISGDVYPWSAVGFRFRWHHLAWIETINATTLERKAPASVSLEAVFVIGQADRDSLAEGGAW